MECIDNGGQHVLVGGWPRKVLQSFGHEVRIEGVGAWASCRFRRVPAPSGDDSLVAIARELKEALKGAPIYEQGGAVIAYPDKVGKVFDLLCKLRHAEGGVK